MQTTCALCAAHLVANRYNHVRGRERVHPDAPKPVGHLPSNGRVRASWGFPSLVGHRCKCDSNRYPTGSNVATEADISTHNGKFWAVGAKEACALHAHGHARTHSCARIPFFWYLYTRKVCTHCSHQPLAAHTYAHVQHDMQHVCSMHGCRTHAVTGRTTRA